MQKPRRALVGKPLVRRHIAILRDEKLKLTLA